MANEKRLIDANALIRNYEAHRNLYIDAWGSFSQMPTIDKVSVDTIDTCISDVINAPTVDAVEVVHGRWEKQQGLYSCSECGKTCPYDVQADTIMYWTCNYCPNCGAKMDGDGNE